MYFIHLLLLSTTLLSSLPLLAQNESAQPADAEFACSACAEWNLPQRPFRIHGNSYYVGPAHFTSGHTPGGTTWTWRSCEGDDCLDIVYADSQTPVSTVGFEFTRSEHYPTAIADFERGHVALERLSCDILVTTHPGASRLWKRLEAREQGTADALIDPDACRRYAASARKQLARRVDWERVGQ